MMLWAEMGDNIRKFFQRVQGETSKKLQPGGGFWKERPRVLPVYERAVFDTKVNYIHRNPLNRLLVEYPEDWEHSSYRQLVLSHSDAAFVCDDWGNIVF